MFISQEGRTSVANSICFYIRCHCLPTMFHMEQAKEHARKEYQRIAASAKDRDGLKAICGDLDEES